MTKLSDEQINAVLPREFMQGDFAMDDPVVLTCIEATNMLSQIVNGSDESRLGAIGFLARKICESRAAQGRA